MNVTQTAPNAPSRDVLEKIFRTAYKIRVFETEGIKLYRQGLIRGYFHPYLGQEGIASGVCAALKEGDFIASTHRGHGHCIAKGVDIVAMMKEIYGRKGGSCNGKGGSMHIADLSKGMMGANGILGAGAPLACGAALAAKLRKKGEVAITFVGDGASNQGTFLESLNLAAVWNLPTIFVVENNGYAESTSRDYGTAVDSYVDRAAGFGMPGVTVDGTDFFAVYEAAGEIIRRAREGGGPTLLECKMVRFHGHFEGDAQTYRGPGENEENRNNKDCLKKFSAEVAGSGVITIDELKAIDADVMLQIEHAVVEAKAAPFPTLADLTTDVYIKY